MQAVLAARASARPRGLQLQHLVVDECVVLKDETTPRPVLFRAKGGVGRIKRRRSKVWLRLREVPGASMQTIVTKPWFERRYKHRKHGAPRRAAGVQGGGVGVSEGVRSGASAAGQAAAAAM